MTSKHLLHLALAMLGASSLAAQVRPIEWPRVIVSVAERRLWVVDSTGDTLFVAPVAVGSGKTVRSPERSWTFRTPLGTSTVRAIEVDPVWVPPEWHYVEIANAKGLRLGRLFADQPAVMSDGRQLVVRDSVIGVVGPDSIFTALPANADLIADSVLFIPPFGTRNRVVRGVLGPYRLLLTNGVGFHGTQDTASIGSAATHGCIRLYERDVTWLYEHVPLGTRVIIR